MVLTKGGGFVQFKVPQNIDMQDRILGPLTLFQLVFLLIGFLIFYGSLRSGSIVLFIFVGIPVGILTLALSFIKINDQPFSRFLTSFLLYIIKPKLRLWHKGGAAPKVTVSKATALTGKPVTAKKLDRQKIVAVASKLDQS